MWQVTDNAAEVLAAALNRIADAMETANEIERDRIEYEHDETAAVIAKQQELAAKQRELTEQMRERMRSEYAEMVRDFKQAIAPESPFRNLHVLQPSSQNINAQALPRETQNRP
jgi:isocitrate dehydrogenase kinase/phosphatase